MSRLAAKSLIAACALSLQAAAFSGPAEAYTLTDWMRTWPNYQPTTFAAPPVLPAQPAVVAPVMPALPYTPPACGAPAAVAPPVVPAIPYTPPSCGAPAAVAPPPVAIAPPVIASPPPVYAPGPSCGARVPSCEARAPSCGVAAPSYAMAAPSCGVAAPVPTASTGCFGRSSPQVAMAYRPIVRYRTSWVRVPTTNYRPITNYDPTSGLAVTAMRPCTTYTWQVRRVPYTSFRPSFTQLFSSPAVPVQTAVPYVQAYPTYSTPQPPAPAPYYSPATGSSQVPLAPPPTSAPLLQAPPVPAAPTGTEAADQQPSLVPGTTFGGGARQPVPEIRRRPVETDPPAQQNGQPAAKQSSAQPAVQVIPDPEAGSMSPQTPVVPSLFDPNDRTAARWLHQVTWDVAPIEWAKPAGTAQQHSAPSQDVRIETSSPSVQKSGTDGWRSVRN